jgi:hypothetical protein
MDLPYPGQNTEEAVAELAAEDYPCSTEGTIAQFGFDPYQVKGGYHSDASERSGRQPNTLQIQTLPWTHLPQIYNWVEHFCNQKPADHKKLSSNDWIRMWQTHRSIVTSRNESKKAIDI